MKIISFADYLFLTKLMVIKYQIKGDCYSKKVPVGGGNGSSVAHLRRRGEPLSRLMRIGGNAST